MIKGVIFDIDGTLLDSMGIWADVGARYLTEQAGVTPEPGLGKILYPMSLEEGAAYVKERYGLAESPEQIKKGVLEIVKKFYYEEAPLKEGAEEFLKTLEEKRIPVVAATSGDMDLALAAFQRLGIGGYFRDVLTCSQVGAGKDSPLIYQKAAKLLDIRPEETLVVEDALFAVKTAKAAGFVTAGVGDSSNLSQRDQIRAEADLYADSLTQILKILKERFWD